MKIVIAGGNQEADYIINMYNNKHNDLVVINPNEDVCRYLSEKNNIEVYFGKASKEADLAEANIYDADFFIGLSNNDEDNYVSCILAKKYFNVNRCIARCSNPKNVDTFKKLGVDSVVSSTFLVAQQIQGAATLENLVSSLSIEDDKIQIMEVEISKNDYVCNKTLSELRINDLGSVSCVYSGNEALIPSGSTKLKNKDKVLLVTTRQKKDKLLKFFQRKINEE